MTSRVLQHYSALLDRPPITVQSRPGRVYAARRRRRRHRLQRHAATHRETSLRVQLPCKYAENVALPALAAVRRVAASCCCCGAGRAAIHRYFLYPPSPQQQTRCTLLQRANGTDRRTDGRTDAAPFHRPCSAYCAECIRRPESAATQKPRDLYRVAACVPRLSRTSSTTFSTTFYAVLLLNYSNIRW